MRPWKATGRGVPARGLCVVGAPLTAGAWKDCFDYSGVRGRLPSFFRFQSRLTLFNRRKQGINLHYSVGYGNVESNLVCSFVVPGNVEEHLLSYKNLNDGILPINWGELSYSQVGC